MLTFVSIELFGQISGLGLGEKKRGGGNKEERRREKGKKKGEREGALAHVLQVDSRDFVHVLKAHDLQVDSRDVVL